MIFLAGRGAAKDIASAGCFELYLTNFVLMRGVILTYTHYAGSVL